jgi:hypothetical protein
MVEGILKQNELFKIGEKSNDIGDMFEDRNGPINLDPIPRFWWT